MSKKAEAIKPTVLTDEEHRGAVFKVAHDAEFEAYKAQIGHAIGMASEADVTEKRSRADAAAKAANKRGVEGPFMPDPERRRIYENNVRGLEAMIVQAEVEEEAGIPSEANLEGLRRQHEAILKIAPSSDAEEAPAELPGPDSGHPGTERDPDQRTAPGEH